jgi:outer membrane biosynthesis protein TonB
MATNRSDTNSPAPSPSIQPRSDEEIVAALRQDVEARRQQIVLRRQLTYNQAGTADDPSYDPGSSWAGWTAQLEKDYGISLENIDREAKTTIEAPFPSEACESVQEEVTADFGVLIAPDGTPIDGSLAVLRSSGYEFFNHQGGEAILAEGFENTTGKDLPFLVTVVFPYTGDACAGNNAENNAGNNAGNNAENPASPTP